MNPRTVVELDGPPDLRRLSARAVAAAAGSFGRTITVAPDDVPDTETLLRRLRPDADRLTTYQQLLGEPVSDDLPAGYVHLLAFPVAMAHLLHHVPLPILGMVHLANRVIQHRPVRLGEELDVRVRATGLRAHRRGVALDVVAEALTDDDVVWQGVSTYLAKGARLAGDDGAPDADRGFTAPVPTGSWRLTPEVGRRYAAVSGDRNPIHTSRVAARAFGFPRRIAHGMYTAARALAEVGPSARGEAFDWEVAFARPVLLPSTVAVRISPDEGSEPGGMAFAVWNQSSGKPHLTGSVRRRT